jgi:predicted transcriptional regulator
MPKKRDYRKEYLATDGRPQDIKERVARNKARREAMKKGLVKKGDGKHVDHKNFNPLDNSPSNLRVISKKANETRQPSRGGKKKK